MNAPSFVAGGLLVAGLLVGPWSGTAHAADEIGLSKDGSTWSTTLSDPLFDPAFRWVPGDDEISSFFVRNQGPTGADLTISVRSADTDQLLGNEDIALFARADGGPWVELVNGVASAALTARTVSRLGIVRVDVRAVFDPASTNQSKTKSVPLTFFVTLSEAVPSATPSPDDSDGSDDGSDDSDDSDDADDSDDYGFLPGSGSTLRPEVLWVAAILIGGGLAIFRRARREDSADV